jgi:PPK2 family polyphosphate:nucleotide phosphotransferase
MKMKINSTDFRVREAHEVDLRKWPTNVEPVYKSKKDYHKLLADHVAQLSSLQQLLYASNRYAALLIFQAMDAAGKDGAIKHVMSGVNPQGCQVFSFKHPSSTELQHDFLWRTTRDLPERGRIGIFNRSHYEEVLVVRVHPENLVAQKLPADAREHHVWKHRYHAINEWERYLTDNGFRIVKLFLNLSREEQRVRFLRRIDLPDHNWKFSSHDVEERQSWDAYQEAFSEMFSHTSTAWAPWYVIPADHKWVSRAAVSSIIVRQISALDLRYPEVTDEKRRQIAQAKKQLESE